MKKYILIFSCLWFFAQLMSFNEPPQSAVNNQIECQEDKESNSEKGETVKLSKTVDAILTVFHFNSLHIIDVPVKEFLITNEYPDFQFVYRAFKIHTEKILYTCIIQVNAP